jgi:nucleotide-binding universal stress UspA family protein
MIGLKQILVPTDFSETSAAALTYGIALADTFGATLHVLHVPDEPLHESWAYIPGECFQDAMASLEARTLRRIEESLPKKAVAAGQTVAAVASGDASEQVIKYAVARQIDLIVCGTHGRRGWNHLMMGSVAEKIVRTAPCPVLTVQHPEREFVLPDAEEPVTHAQA